MCALLDAQCRTSGRPTNPRSRHPSPALISILLVLAASSVHALPSSVLAENSENSLDALSNVELEIARLEAEAAAHELLAAQQEAHAAEQKLERLTVMAEREAGCQADSPELRVQVHDTIKRAETGDGAAFRSLLDDKSKSDISATITRAIGYLEPAVRGRVGEARGRLTSGTWMERAGIPGVGSLDIAGALDTAGKVGDAVGGVMQVGSSLASTGPSILQMLTDLGQCFVTPKAKPSPQPSPQPSPLSAERSPQQPSKAAQPKASPQSSPLATSLLASPIPSLPSPAGMNVPVKAGGGDALAKLLLKLLNPMGLVNALSEPTDKLIADLGEDLVSSVQDVLPLGLIKQLLSPILKSGGITKLVQPLQDMIMKTMNDLVQQSMGQTTGLERRSDFERAFDQTLERYPILRRDAMTVVLERIDPEKTEQAAKAAIAFLKKFLRATAKSEFMPTIISCSIDKGLIQFITILEPAMKEGAMLAAKVGLELMEAVQQSGVIEKLLNKLIKATPIGKDLVKIKDVLEGLVIGSVAHTCTKTLDEMTAIQTGVWPKSSAGVPKTPEGWCAEEEIALDDSLLMKTLLQDAVPEFIKWLYGVIDGYVLMPIEVQILSVVTGIINDITQTLDGLCGIIPEVGGLICDIIVDTFTALLDALGPQLIHDLFAAVKKAALELTLKMVPMITDPIISTMVDILQAEGNSLNSTLTTAASSGAVGQMGGGELKVLIDLVVPMVKQAAEEMLFPALKPERIKCRIRLRKLRAIMAPTSCPGGQFVMPPEEVLPEPEGGGTAPAVAGSLESSPDVALESTIASPLVELAEAGQVGTSELRAAIADLQADLQSEWDDSSAPVTA